MPLRYDEEIQNLLRNCIENKYMIEYFDDFFIYNNLGHMYRKGKGVRRRTAGIAGIKGRTIRSETIA